ncbi:TPA: hypothetical protein MOX20_004282 [Salmonella enterica subsp. salamae serovar 35:g,m,s,t:-]|nr:hypothetical protein [Salmonella enterica subsp. salamae serovar 35:g,m,s,t:-]
MLIRQKGANDGVGEYLVSGKKQDRIHSRDELDERVVLSGNLNITNAIIDSIVSDKERYNHYTLSFAEDHISDDAALKIVNEFKKFALSAYKEEEYNFYAESHNPRIKSILNKQTGEMEERKPHIHIIIPKVNLVSGTYLNPFGLMNHHIRYIDAFQEHINQKFDLISPKDKRRTSFTDGSDILSRYKADVFNPGNKEVKAKLLLKILENNPQTTQELASLASEFGVVKYRNKGKENEYLNLKVPDAPKGVNLKDYPFSNEFLTLPLDAKIKAVEEPTDGRPESRIQPKRTAAENGMILKEWHQIKAREIRFIRAGNKERFKFYSQSSVTERAQMIDEQERNFYVKYGDELNVANRSVKPTANAVTGSPKNGPRKPPPSKRGNLYWLSTGDVARERVGIEVLLRKNVRDNLSDGGDKERVSNVLRRVPDSDSGGRKPVASVVDSYLENKIIEKQARTASELPEIKEIRTKLDAARLLAALAQSHGVDSRKYGIAKGKDGADRLVCGKRRYTVNDFLTKELHLAWPDAEKILREQYSAQLKNEPYERPVLTPKSELWSQYQDWIRNNQQIKEEEQGAQKDREKKKRNELHALFRNYKTAVWNDKTLSWKAKRSAISVINMEKVLADQRLRAQLSEERAALRRKWGFLNKERYLYFLQQEASRDNEAALEELRRVTTARQTTVDPDLSSLKGDGEQAPKLVRGRDYQVRLNGDVAYKVNGHTALLDTGRWVRVLTDDDHDTIEIAIRLALEKNHYKPLNITGSDSFKKAVAEVLVSRGIRAEFEDPGITKLVEALREAQRADKEAQRRTAHKPRIKGNQH